MNARVRRRLVALVLVCAGPSWVQAQQLPGGPPLAVWGPNGAVHALGRVSNTLFVGGEFDYIGPPTGAFAIIDIDDASSVSAPTFVLGPTGVLSGDGSGGWFGAPATPFGSLESYQVVHLRPDGTRDPAWQSPVIGPNRLGERGWINSIVVDSGRLLVAGAFASVNGTARTGIAAFDASTGGLLPWTVQVEGSRGVNLSPQIGALTSGRLYLSGNFTAVNGTSRAGVAAVDAATGAVLPFDVPAGVGTSIVSATPTAVYAWCRPIRLCAFDLTGAPLAGWSPPALANVASVLVTPTSIFTSIAEQGQWRLISLDPATGARRPWSEPVFTGAPPALERAGGRLYVAGDFRSVNGTSRSRIAALDEATGTLLPWAPAVGGIVYGIRVQGQRVAIAGGFNSVGGAARRNLAAIDLTTGRPHPSPDLAFDVRAFHALGDIVVASGGAINTPGRVVAFSASSGALLPWSLDADNEITALASTERYLFLAGRFRTIAGQPRNGLAAVDLTTASLAPLDQSSVWSLNEMAVSNGVVFASGYVPIPSQVLPVALALDAVSLGRLPFTPTPAPGATEGFAFGPGRVLVVGSMSQGPRQAGWFDAVSGQWSPRLSAQDFVGTRATQAGSMIVVAGNVHPGLRVAIEVINGETGAGVPWDPGLIDGTFTSITAMHASDDYVVLGGTIDAAAGVPVANLAVFRTPRAGAPRQITAAVAAQTVTLGWQPGLSPAASAFIVEGGSAPGVSDLGRVNVGTATSVAGTLGAGRYFIRVRGAGAAGEGSASSEVAVDVPATAVPPSAPGTLAASVTGTNVSLAWGTATGNATTYVVEAGSASGGADLVVYPTGNLDTALVTAAPPGRYYVRVRAANTSGRGPVSNEVVIDVP